MSIRAVVVPVTKYALTTSAQSEGLVGAASSLHPKKTARTLSPISHNLYGRSDDVAPTKPNEPRTQRRAVSTKLALGHATP